VADVGYISAQLSAVPDATTRRILQDVFKHVLGNIRIGVPAHQTRAVNLQAYWLNSTTPAIANEEFSIAHGLPSTPHYALPVLELDKPGAQTVSLTVSRAADSKRIYLKSASTSAPILILVEP
jgi:hypothetical protein